MDKYCINEDMGLNYIFKQIDYRIKFKQEFPQYLDDIGTMIFCGSQGSGKTLSAVNYVYNLMRRYKLCVLVTNIALTDYPFNCYLDDQKRIRTLEGHKLVSLCSYSALKNGADNWYTLEQLPYICIEYSGLDVLKYINNYEFGVVYLIDEIHLELNSLESQNIDIDIMIEISQQRKQRKKIIGTSQVYMRLAKPLREQVFDVVLCRCFFKFIQFNKCIDGLTAVEKDGKLQCQVKKRVFYVHSLDMYKRYDTFAKMKRLSKEWKGRQRVLMD